MKKSDFMSIFIAVVISTFIFFFFELLTKQNEKSVISEKNLGDITVKSITIEEGGGLYIRDLNGTRRFLIDLIDDNVVLSMLDKEGNLFFDVGEQGGSRGLLLLDKTSEASILLSTTEGGGAFFNLKNRNGSNIATITVGDDNEGVFALFNRHGDIGPVITGK